MSIALNGDGIISGVSTITNPSDIAVGTGASVFSPATNTLALGTNGSERVRVTSSGQFIMPAGSFDLMVGDSTDSNAGTQTISVGSTASGSGGIQLWANPTNGNSWIQFGDNSASASHYRGWVNYQHADDNLNFGTAGTERARITSTGNVQIANGNLVFSTAGTGIDFSATADGSGTTTSELLDDYEEGTWTPVMYGSSTAGTWSSTAPQHGGFYIKVGNQVTAWANLYGTLSGATGNIRISGLPFSRAATNSPTGSGNAGYSNGSIQYWSGISVMALSPLIAPDNTMYFHTYTTTSTSSAIVAVVNGIHNLHFFVTYFV